MSPTSDKQTTPAIIHLTASAHFIIRLNQTNFPTWRRQIESTLIGLDLHHHIDGTSRPPTANSTEYSQWYRQDQILFSALLSSCTDAIQPLISSATTSREAWKRLTTAYANTSRSRIISLKSKLTANPKGSRSISEFLHEMRSIADELALAQEPVKDEDLMIHVLNQLGAEFQNIVAALKTRDTPVSYSELYAKLLDCERELQAIPQPEPTVTTVNYTQRHSPRTNQTRHPPTNDTRSNRNSHPPTNRTQWQSRNFNNNTRLTRNNNNHCYYCNIPGHDTKDCRKLSRFLREHNVSPQNNSAPVVNYTTPHPTAPTPSWMWDTGASNNTANNQQQFPVLSEYGGPDEIVLGDGSTHGGASHAGSERQ